MITVDKPLPPYHRPPKGQKPQIPIALKPAETHKPPIPRKPRKPRDPNAPKRRKRPEDKVYADKFIRFIADAVERGELKYAYRNIPSRQKVGDKIIPIGYDLDITFMDNAGEVYSVCVKVADEPKIYIGRTTNKPCITPAQLRRLSTPPRNCYGIRHTGCIVYVKTAGLYCLPSHYILRSTDLVIPLPLPSCYLLSGTSPSSTILAILAILRTG